MINCIQWENKDLLNSRLSLSYTKKNILNDFVSGTMGCKVFLDLGLHLSKGSIYGKIDLKEFCANQDKEKL